MSTRSHCLVSVLACLAATPVADPARADDSKVRAKVLEYLEPIVQMRDFSGAVLVAHEDNVLVREAFGYADFERKVPNQAVRRNAHASSDMRSPC